MRSRPCIVPRNVHPAPNEGKGDMKEVMDIMTDVGQRLEDLTIASLSHTKAILGLNLPAIMEEKGKQQKH